MNKADSRCGLHCTGCCFKESAGCGGCIETNGQPFHGECGIAVCCQERGYTHCGECEVLPCEKLYAYSYLDPEHGDKPPGKRIAQLRQWAAEQGVHQWKNVLLTDSGWGGSIDGGADQVLRRFWKMLGKPPAQAKVLFIPTAANSDESRPAAGKCFAEVLSAGILPNHIRIYDIDGALTWEEAREYDVLYFTGGDTEYLLKRMKETGFDETVKRMVYANKVYVGASAGSLIATPNIGGLYDKEKAGLCLINAYISVHNPPRREAGENLPHSPGTEAGENMQLPEIALSGGQALAVSFSGYEVIA